MLGVHLLWALPLAGLFLVVGEASTQDEQARSLASMSDEILKVQKLVDGATVAARENIVNDPDVNPQSTPLRVQEAARFADEGASQDASFQAWAYPQPQTLLQPMMPPYNAMQEMSNLLASNRKLRNQLNLAQKKEAELTNARVKVNEGLAHIATMVDATANEEQHLQERLKSMQERIDEEQQKEKELTVANAKLLQANAELQAKQTKLAISNATLQVANTQLRRLMINVGETEKHMEFVVAGAEQKARKAEEESERLAAQVGAAQASMLHTQEIMRQLLPRIAKQPRRTLQHRVEKVNAAD